MRANRGRLLLVTKAGPKALQKQPLRSQQKAGRPPRRCNEDGESRLFSVAYKNRHPPVIEGKMRAGGFFILVDQTILLGETIPSQG